MSNEYIAFDLFAEHEQEEIKKREKIGSLESLRQNLDLQDFMRTTLRTHSISSENNSGLYQDPGANGESRGIYDEEEDH